MLGHVAECSVRGVPSDTSYYEGGELPEAAQHPWAASRSHSHSVPVGGCAGTSVLQFG